jgi:hypothetical protein
MADLSVSSLARENLSLSATTSTLTTQQRPQGRTEAPVPIMDP